MKQKKAAAKLTREQREAIDNKLVIATAIFLVGGIALMFINRWMLSTYYLGTRIVVLTLMWVGVAAVPVFLGLYWRTKNSGHLCLSIWGAALAAASALIIYNPLNIIAYKFQPFGITGVNSHVSYFIVGAALFAYLIISYIHYGRQLKK